MLGLRAWWTLETVAQVGFSRVFLQVPIFFPHFDHEPKSVPDGRFFFQDGVEAVCFSTHVVEKYQMRGRIGTCGGARQHSSWV